MSVKNNIVVALFVAYIVPQLAFAAPGTSGETLPYLVEKSHVRTVA